MQFKNKMATKHRQKDGVHATQTEKCADPIIVGVTGESRGS